MVRAFVAIEVPGTVCRIMDSARECLSALADDLCWTAPENIHLTLKFLGESGTLYGRAPGGFQERIKSRGGSSHPTRLQCPE